MARTEAGEGGARSADQGRRRERERYGEGLSGSEAMVWLPRPGQPARRRNKRKEKKKMGRKEEKGEKEIKSLI